MVRLLLRHERDAELDRAALVERDAAIGHDLPATAKSPIARTLAWLDHPRIASDDDAEVAERIHRGAATAAAVFVLMGAALGFGAAAGLVSLEAGARVNVVWLVAVLVGPQLVMLLAFLAALLPGRWLDAIPLVAGLADLAGWVRGRLFRRATLARLPERARHLIDRATDRAPLVRHRTGVVGKWTVIAWLQQFAIAFNLGALAALFAFVALTDVAFGWSTTLDMETDQMHAIVSGIASPWQWAMPAATVDRETIEATRYFRVTDQPVADPEVLGRWWMFVMMTVVVYGLVPRVGTGAVAAWRRRAALREAMMRWPETQDLLDRLSQPIVSTRATEPEAERRVTARAAAESVPTESVATREACVINYGALPVDASVLTERIAQTWQVEVTRFDEAGGASLADDQRLVESLAGEGVGAVFVAVKGWEPPVMDAVDFLVDLRNAGDGHRVVTAVVVGVDDAGRITAPGDSTFADWAAKVRALGDPRISAATPDGRRA